MQKFWIARQNIWIVLVDRNPLLFIVFAVFADFYPKVLDSCKQKSCKQIFAKCLHKSVII